MNTSAWAAMGLILISGLLAVIIGEIFDPNRGRQLDGLIEEVQERLGQSAKQYLPNEQTRAWASALARAALRLNIGVVISTSFFAGYGMSGSLRLAALIALIATTASYQYYRRVMTRLAREERRLATLVRCSRYIYIRLQVPTTAPEGAAYEH